MRLLHLAWRNLCVSIHYVYILAGASLFCMVLLWTVTSPESFNDYSDAFQVAFAITCASILVGLLLSISLICEDYIMIRREIKMGLSPILIITAKTINIIIYCLVISAILIFPYFFNAFNIQDQNLLYLYFGVFFTMLAAAELGLFVSALWRNKPQIASLFVSIIMLFQILFSGFLFDDAKLEIFGITVSISHYSIRAIGSGLRFDLLDTGLHRVFEISPGHIRENIGLLAVFFGLSFIGSIVILYYVEIRGKDTKLRPE